MSIAKTVIDCLQRNHVPYCVVSHSRTGSTRETAQAVKVPPERIAKAVVLHDRVGYVMAVVPANRHVKLESLSEKLGRVLSLVAEERLTPVFRDCDVGAIPPIGAEYGLETILDDSLVGQPEIYFEAGDHEELIRVDGEQFLRLMRRARHGQFRH